MPSRTNGVGVQAEDTMTTQILVGLPARGKSYIAQRGKFGGCLSSIAVTMANRSTV